MKFGGIYKAIKLNIYRNMFKKIKDQDEQLTSTEYFCLEIIYLMDKPTISQFADFLDISSPNATYKVKSLIKKGLVEKQKSKKDGREYLLVPTQKYFELFQNSKVAEETNLNKVKNNYAICLKKYFIYITINIEI